MNIFASCFYCICARLCGCVGRGGTTGSYGMPTFSFAGVGLHCHQQCESISPSTVAESFVGVSWLRCAFPKWLMEFMSYIYVYSQFGYLFFLKCFFKCFACFSFGSLFFWMGTMMLLAGCELRQSRVSREHSYLGASAFLGEQGAE